MRVFALRGSVVVASRFAVMVGARDGVRGASLFPLCEHTYTYGPRSDGISFEKTVSTVMNISIHVDVYPFGQLRFTFLQRRGSLYSNNWHSVCLQQQPLHHIRVHHESNSKDQNGMEGVQE
jgi:hypothetical protein